MKNRLKFGVLCCFAGLSLFFACTKQESVLPNLPENLNAEGKRTTLMGALTPVSGQVQAYLTPSKTFLIKSLDLNEPSDQYHAIYLNVDEVSADFLPRFKQSTLFRSLQRNYKRLILDSKESSTHDKLKLFCQELYGGSISNSEGLVKTVIASFDKDGSRTLIPLSDGQTNIANRLFMVKSYFQDENPVTEEEAMAQKAVYDSIQDNWISPVNEKHTVWLPGKTECDYYWKNVESSSFTQWVGDRGGNTNKVITNINYQVRESWPGWDDYYKNRGYVFKYYGDLLRGPGSITFSKSTTTTIGFSAGMDLGPRFRPGSKTSLFSMPLDAVSGALSGAFSMTFGRTIGTSYSIDVAKGKTARLAVLGDVSNAWGHSYGYAGVLGSVETGEWTRQRQNFCMEWLWEGDAKIVPILPRWNADKTPTYPGKPGLHETYWGAKIFH